MTLVWSSDLAQADSTAAGWKADSGDRQTAAGDDAASGIARPLPVTTAPDGRRAVLVALPDSSKRNELQPNHAKLGEGASGFFGSTFWVPTGIPDANAGSYYQVIEQQRQASYVGSPPVALEVRGGALLLSGGAGMGASGNLDQYKYERVLKAVCPLDRWLPIIYSITNYSATAGASTLDVWLGRERLLTGFVIPPPTVVAAPAGQTGNTDGLTYRKQGLYHWSGNPTAAIWLGAARYGTTFADVDVTDLYWREPRRTPRPAGAV